jgi:Bacterial Ig-like domain (group 3)
MHTRTVDFAAFLGRRNRARPTTSPPTCAVRFLLAMALAGGLGAAIANAAGSPAIAAGPAAAAGPIATAAGPIATAAGPPAAAAGPPATAAGSPAATTAGTAQPSLMLRVAKQVRAGRRTTMTASLSVPAATPAPPAPTGTVRFSDRGKPISGCTAQKISNLVATCSVTFIVAGKHPISARYGGDATYAPATSSSSTLAVKAIPIKGDITARTSWVFRFTPTSTSVLSLTVGGLYEGSDVLLGCRGKGCPFRSEDFPVLRPKKCSPTIPATSCPPNNFFLTKYFAGRQLAVGAQITILISHPSYIGKYYSFTMRARQKPSVQIACLAPESSLPGVGCRSRPDQNIPG